MTPSESAVTKDLGREVLAEALEAFKRDRRMALLPVLPILVVILAFTPIFVAAAISSNGALWLIIFAIAGCMVAGFLATLSNVALAIAAASMFEAEPIGPLESLTRAWSRRSLILRWTFLSAFVGGAIRMLDERTGIGGRLIGLGAAIGWGTATVLVVPLIAFDPELDRAMSAVKQSARLVLDNFAGVARAALRLGLRVFVPAGLGIGLFVGSLVIANRPGGSIAVAQAMAVAGVAISAVTWVYASVVGMYMRTALYRRTL